MSELNAIHQQVLVRYMKEVRSANIANLKEIKSVLKTTGENYKVKMTEMEKENADKFYLEEVEHAH